jgi:MazG family protein
MPDVVGDAGAEFVHLVSLMRRLRAPDGCPWDRKQTFDTIKAYLLEETYEVMDAIDRRDWPELAEELGDLLLQPVFLAQMAAEQHHFTIGDCLAAINQKLVRRHPHIFGDATAETAEEVKIKWDEIKRQEKAEKGAAARETSTLDGVLSTAPALMEALQLSKKAAGVGFEWPDANGVLEKLQEEAAELVEAQRSPDYEHVEHEIGDLFFTLVNLARFLKVDPEQSLRKTNKRFRQRFGLVEKALADAGSRPEDASVSQMEMLWQRAKRQLAASETQD